MPTHPAEWILGLAALYLVVGLLFAVPFALKGAGRIDPLAATGTWGFRLLVIPGAAAFWPLLLRRWLGGTGAPPVERTPHKGPERGVSPEAAAAAAGAGRGDPT